MDKIVFQYQRFSFDLQYYLILSNTNNVLHSSVKSLTITQKITARKLAFCKSSSHIPANIPHPTHQTSHIRNISHLQHLTSPTSYILNIPYPQTSHISNIPHPEPSTSQTPHIPNIQHPGHPTSPTSCIPNYV